MKLTNKLKTKKNFICIVVVLTLLLSSVNFVFADDNDPVYFVPPNDYETLPTITNNYGTFYDYPIQPIDTMQLSSWSNYWVGNDYASSRYFMFSALKPILMGFRFGYDENNFLAKTYATSGSTSFIIVLNGEVVYNVSVTRDVNNYKTGIMEMVDPVTMERYFLLTTQSGTFSLRKPFQTDQTLTDFLLYLLNGDNFGGGAINYFTYKFNVPSGQMLHILADNIQNVYVKYNIGFGLFRPSSQTLNANRYNYLVSDYANINAFGDSNLINWTKNDNSSYIFNIEHDNSNSLNFYNFSFADTERQNNYEVYITCSNAKAYMYSQNWRGQVIESTSSSGALFFGGGNGSTDSPYNVQLYDTDNNAIYKPSTLEVDTTSQDSAMNTIVETLTAPTRFIGVITDSTSGLLQTVSSMFSWLPVELTSLIVGSFSVVIAVGVLKMFL